MEYSILQKSDPVSVDMVGTLPTEEVTAWYDFTKFLGSLGCFE